MTQVNPGVRGRFEAETVAIQLRRTRDRVAIATGLIAAALSIASTWYYFRHQLILGYQDSFSHLELSRRVVSGLSPGIAQLGGVWLPVPQLLQDLFSWNYTLYRTGLAGAAVSMASYVAATVLLYRLVRLFSGDRRWPAVAGAMAFAVNVNVLYQQSTPMDELPFYAFTIAAVFYLVKWGETGASTNLLAASVASMLAMFCRYEGWFLGVVYVICAVAIGRRLGHSWRDVRGLIVVPASFGLLIPAGAWLLYNFLIFGNPLNFANGAGSSAAQMALRHEDINVGSWPLTLKGYGIAVGSDLGLAVLCLAAMGLIVFLVAERFSARSVPVLGLLTLLPFYLYTLEKGAEPITLPEQAGLLNYRFGLVIMIPAAILIGYLIIKIPGRAVTMAALVTTVGLAGLSALSLVRHQVVLATEGAQDLYAQRNQIQAADFLAQHTGGLILIDIVQNERVDFDVIDRTVYDGTKEAGHNQWPAVLRDPEIFGVKTIVMRLPNPIEPPDVVYGALHHSPRLKAYRLVYHSTTYLIYSMP